MSTFKKLQKQPSQKTEVQRLMLNPTGTDVSCVQLVKLRRARKLLGPTVSCKAACKFLLSDRLHVSG